MRSGIDAMIAPERGIRIHIVKTLPIPEVMTAISSSAGIPRWITG
jgi:hypothetical protein